MSRSLRRHHDKRLKAKARYRAMNELQWYGEFTARDAGVRVNGHRLSTYGRDVDFHSYERGQAKIIYKEAIRGRGRKALRLQPEYLDDHYESFYDWDNDYPESWDIDAGIYWSRADSYDDYEYSDHYEDEDPWDTGHYAVPDYDLYWAY